FTNEIKRQSGVVDVTGANSSFTKGYLIFYLQNDKQEDKEVYTFHIKANYIKTMGMGLVAGRDYNPALSSDSTEAIIVNEAMVSNFNWKDPIGKQSEYFGKERKVIGVVKNFHFQSLESPVEPAMLILGSDDDMD